MSAWVPWIEGIAGVFLVVIILFDVFLTVVVPRRAPQLGRLLRLSRYVIAKLWTLWRWLGLRMSTTERRESFLGAFGALSIIVLLAGWVAALVLGYGLILDSLKTQIKPEPENLGTAIYFAGTALLTLGFGDFVALSGPARLTTLVAAASGLGTFAVVITLLYSLYGSFQRRETAVVVLEAGAGAPPSGVTLLETRPETLLATHLDDQPLSDRQGYPIRLLVPFMYGYKSVKWLSRVSVENRRYIGFWERRGWQVDPYV